ncbi:MAG: UpxZ family transcription anti-terminator antagonist [Bacteroides sp.]|nr:UpxZ family transcription anti-terminator antagonist [Bacteroides sp.]
MIKQAEELRALAEELLRLGENGGAVYIDQFRQLNQEIREKADLLFLQQGEDAEQEAQMCLALLIAYSVVTYPVDCQNQKIQSVLDRCFVLLNDTDFLNVFLRGKLLIYCYYFIGDKELECEILSLINNGHKQENVTEIEELSVLYRTVTANIIC